MLMLGGVEESAVLDALHEVTGPPLASWLRSDLLGIRISVSDISCEVQYGARYEPHGTELEYPVVEVDFEARSDRPLRGLQVELARVVGIRLTSKLSCTGEVCEGVTTLATIVRGSVSGST